MHPQNLFQSRRISIAALTVGLLGTAVQADIVSPLLDASERVGKYSILGSAIPTPGLAGYTTYTLKFETDVASIGGLDFLGGSGVGNFGFFGPMHQVQPSGQSSVFRDSNNVMEASGWDSQQDSQFLFQSSDILSIRPDESDTTLQAVFAGFEPFGTDFAFAQIVVPDGELVTFSGVLAFTHLEVDLPEQRFDGVVGSGVLFESDVFRPLPPPPPPPPPAPKPVVIETPPPSQLIIEPPAPMPNPIVVDDPPLTIDSPEPDEPPVPKPAVPEVDPLPSEVVRLPIWIDVPFELLPFPELRAVIDSPEGASIDLVHWSSFVPYNHGDAVYVNNATIDDASLVAFGGVASAGQLNGVEQPVPEPAAIVQSLLAICGAWFWLRADRAR